MTMRIFSLTSLVFMSATMLLSSALSAADTTTATTISPTTEQKAENAVHISRFQSLFHRNKHSKHALAFDDTKVTLSHQVRKQTDAFSAIEAGIRHVHFGYKDMHSKGMLYGVIGAKAGFIANDNWTWQGLARVEVPTKGWGLVNDSRYVAAVQGSYLLNSDVTFFIGFGAETGMRATDVQPILGAQYRWDDWVFHAVYPNPRVIYNGIKDVQLSFNIENIFTAVRSRRVGSHRNGVATFRGTGAEFRADHVFTDQIKGWVSLGRVFHSRVTMGDKYNHSRTTHNVHGPVYAQVGVSYLI